MIFRDRDRSRTMKEQSYREKYRERPQDIYRNDYRRGHYREVQNYRDQKYES